MTDSSGTVVWSADYKPFGEATISSSSTITNNLRFPGQYYDAETGLNYNYMRDYNPVIGRYVEADPIGIIWGSNHIYAYVGNKPVNHADTTGLFVPPALKPGGDCMICDWGAIISCMLKKPATPNSANNCATCIFTFNPYTGTYNQQACASCGLALTTITVDCVKDNCHDGKRNSCGQCII